LRFNYGETTTDLAGTVVSKRSWNAGSSYDFHPFADFSPFLRASIESRLARFAGLSVTFRDNYDSKAILRGARTNNDGEVLVGLLTTF
jgi:hypothetical protein